MSTSRHLSGNESSVIGDLFDVDDNGHDKDKNLNQSEMIPEFSLDMKEFNSFEMIDEDTAPNIPFTENALRVLERRYLKKNERGEVIETPVQLFRRVARFIASADAIYDPSANLQRIEETFYHMMSNLEFLPNSPTLMNAGRELGQLSACFVLPVEDSMASIFDAVKNTALIHKSGGGTGFSFSRIRPKNDIVQSTRGIASGPISFMHVFDEATETVKQGGTRRGANMAILRVDHPDILEFINAKENDDHLNNFNISVAITEAFWKALETERDYDLINPHTEEKSGCLNAKEVFTKIVHHAWKNGDPGVIFIDRLNRDNPTPQLGDIESTNPCGEQPLLPFESCNLGSINLAKMVTTDNGHAKINYDKLKETVQTAVHFLDNVIDVNKYPLPEIEKMTKSTRKIGLGVMGFADMLLHLNIPYNSDTAIETAQEVMNFINDAAKHKSQEIALQRGEFPAFSKSIYAQRGEPSIRNATRTTIAPTGTISIIAGCSSGIEPLFALSFTRHVMDDDKLPELNAIFTDRMKTKGLYDKNLMRKVAIKGSIDEIEEIPESIRRIFVTSHEVSPEWHIRMQAAFQNFTDNAVSKTVNFPNSATVDDVTEVYRLAHDLGCKGVTIYRDGSREVQVLNKGEGSKKTSSVSEARPKILRGFTAKVNTGQGSLYITINTDENNKPVEVFANIGKSGGDTAALAEAIGRLISIALQKGVSVEEMCGTLMGITGSRPVWNDGILVKSVPDGIGQVLLKEFGKEKDKNTHATAQQEMELDDTSKNDHFIFGPECPECGDSMITEGGCAVCRQCGHSLCG